MGHSLWPKLKKLSGRVIDTRSHQSPSERRTSSAASWTAVIVPVPEPDFDAVRIEHRVVEGERASP